jgi:predicted SAM-dependent methyltransferase
VTWSLENSCGFESRKIKYLIPRYTRGRGLEIGCGQEKAYQHFIGVDNGHHFGKGAADIVAQADDLSMFADESMDFVFSSHVLEHMVDMGKALSEWGRVIKPGGYLVLYVPSANLYPKMGVPGANPDHKHDIYPGDIEKMLEDGVPHWEEIESEERNQDNEYSLFEVYRKVKP